MHRVLEECDRAAKGFEADPVHDLRVALRRCRSLADGLMAIDPDPAWKDMKKAGKKLFQALGDLRDMQVVEEWIAKLSVAPTLAQRVRKDGASAAGDAASRVSTGNRSDRGLGGSASGDSASGDSASDEAAAADPVAVTLLDHVRGREAECKQSASKALQQFDRKQWRQWSRTLPHRASRVRPGSVVYQHLALEKWTAAHELHQRALRTRSQFAWHQLRIGIKRFRYTVENFLPRQHALWGSDLKELQDLLGEVHDLDVLWALAVEIGAFPDAESRSRWREKLNLERDPRIARYREKMVGRESLWRVWRAELPSGERLRRAAMSRLRVWAGFQDPDFSHSRRVARLAILLYDGLKNAGLVTASTAPADLGANPRAVLRAAAFMHDAGKAKGTENYQKQTYRMIRGLARPMGWSARELELAAVVARYHRGTLPRPRGKAMQLLELPDRPIAMELAGILRLANALSHHPDDDQGHRRAGSSIKSASAKESPPRIEVSLNERCVLLRVEGYSALDRSAEGVAAARHLLETVLRRPVLVRALASRSEKPRAKSQQPTAQ
jgi:CHAD domain-containing protein